MIDLTLSKKMKSQYSLGYPFPHIVIDEFLPEFLVNKSLKEVIYINSKYINFIILKLYIVF